MQGVESPGAIASRDTVVPVKFRFSAVLAPQARRVALLGPFNGWNARSHRLLRTGDGEWTLTLYLPRGEVQYCFDVDGAYWLDPDDDGRVPNGWGSEYSVKQIR